MMLTNVFLIVFIALSMMLWFWALMDIHKSRFKNRSSSFIWFVIVLFFPVLGSIIYFQLRRKLVETKPRKFRPDFHKR
ncbi:MAG: PLDc N-terminal domain-containing protein [Bacteroidota bacterium]